MSILDLQALPLAQAQQGTVQALGASNLSIVLCVAIAPESQDEDRVSSDTDRNVR